MTTLPTEIREIIVNQFSSVVVRNFNTFAAKDTSDEKFVEELTKFSKIPVRETPSLSCVTGKTYNYPVTTTYRTGFDFSDDEFATNRHGYSYSKYSHESDEELEDYYSYPSDSESDGEYILSEYIPTE